MEVKQGRSLRELGQISINPGPQQLPTATEVSFACEQHGAGCSKAPSEVAGPEGTQLVGRAQNQNSGGQSGGRFELS